MTQTSLIAAALLTFVGACTTATGTAMSDEAARAAARSVVTPIVAQQVPGAMGIAMSDCIINNASATELLALARAATNGVSPATVTLTSQVLSRPETVACATAALTT